MRAVCKSFVGTMELVQMAVYTVEGPMAAVEMTSVGCSPVMGIWAGVQVDVQAAVQKRWGVLVQAAGCPAVEGAEAATTSVEIQGVEHAAWEVSPIEQEVGMWGSSGCTLGVRSGCERCTPGRHRRQNGLETRVCRGGHCNGVAGKTESVEEEV